MLAHYWQPNTAMEDVYSQIFSSDPDEHARAAALSCIIEIHRGSKHKDRCEFFAKIVRSEDESQIVRRLAYVGLLQVLGRRITMDLRQAFRASREILPRESDWATVDSFLEQGI
jgi:hypothetical protein